MFIDAFSELVVCGETDIPAVNIRMNINQTKEHVTGEALTGFQKQFQVMCIIFHEVVIVFKATMLQTLEQISSPEQYQASYIEAKAEYNSNMNRFPHKLQS